jgi:TPR repeat protein
MRDHRSSSLEDAGQRRWTIAARAGAVAALVALGGLAVTACGDRGVQFWRQDVSAESCPRPASVTGAGGEFNDQEQDIRRLRRAAFGGDFFAQLELGSRYAAARATDKNIEDPIESSVWYAMALANPEGYAPINASVRAGVLGWRPLSRYDDCRAFERESAYRQLNRALSQMTRAEQERVRDRVVYILSTQDAEGFRTLARLHDDLYGPFVLLKDFERSTPARSRYGAFVEAKARRWIPPYEFYPNESPESGVPHSDESRSRGDAREHALQRISELPFVHVGRALRYLGVTETVAGAPAELSKRQIETLEAMLGHPMEGRLSNLERVRAIQLAAVNGSSEAQLVLAVMYAEGVGLPADYARAFHWFSEADRQGSPEARFAMSTYFALGVAGVADQDKAQAVAYRIDSALSGFGPSAARLQAVLAQVSRSQRQ